ncbi:hypothetical protein ACFOD4_14610 [Pseudoroseomonas globiformis]|uniref:OmpA-like domain-containing protein n=1 Tax=Teichococcus globiformis TaxID=2307229 RepID=A0ABV7G7W2_9PROT
MPLPSHFAALCLAALLLHPAALHAAEAGRRGSSLPPDPASSAPAPPDLQRPPQPAGSLPQPGVTLPRSMEALPGGGWRLSGALARGEIDAAAETALSEIARWLARSTTGRVTLSAQVAGPEDDLSTARRDSLAHGLAIRRQLEAAGLDGTRIDTRPLGRTAEARDGIDLLPPVGKPASTTGESAQPLPGGTARGEDQPRRPPGATRQP